MTSKHSLASLAIAAILLSAAAGAATAQADVEMRITKATDVTELTAFRHVQSTAVFKVAGPALQLTATDEAAAQALQLAALNRADQYALRQIDRQRPDVTPAWRECPSV